jgi:hypothetical protein
VENCLTSRLKHKTSFLKGLQDGPSPGIGSCDFDPER